MKNLALRGATALLLATPIFGCNAASGGGAGSGRAVDLKTDDQKTLYALGLMLGRNIASFKLNGEELDAVRAGLTDAATGTKPKVELETYGPKVQAFARGRATAAAENEKKRAQPFLDTAAKEQGAVKTDSGLVFRTLKPGTGKSPTASDRVKVHYHGTLTDGTVFDSSVQRGTPAEFPLGGVIKCWTEGVQKMKVGEKAKLTCPSSIAYGDQGRPPTIPGGATLTFEVELLDILPNTPPANPFATMPGAPGGKPLVLPPGAKPMQLIPPGGAKPAATTTPPK
jgi:FKBP-type peptidyl-prolyl cis-trans isomerase FkpA